VGLRLSITWSCRGESPASDYSAACASTARGARPRRAADLPRAVQLSGGRNLLKGVRSSRRRHCLHPGQAHEPRKILGAAAPQTERSFGEARSVAATLESSFTSLLAGHERAALAERRFRFSGSSRSCGMCGRTSSSRRIRSGTARKIATSGARRVARISATSITNFLCAEGPAGGTASHGLADRGPERPQEAVLQPAITAAAAGGEPLVLAGHGADAVFGGCLGTVLSSFGTTRSAPARCARELYTYTRYKRMPASGSDAGRRGIYGEDSGAPPTQICILARMAFRNSTVLKSTSRPRASAR
jgi:hypothetical protein